MDLERAIIETRLAKIKPLKDGAHTDHKAMCIMEAVAFVAGEPWSDSPVCACPVISAFLRSWNDSLPDAERDALLRPFIVRLVNTKRDENTEKRRAIMAADWLIRVHTPAWLRLAGLTTQADALTALPEITDFAQCPSLMPTLNAVRHDADAAWNAAWSAAWSAAGSAAWSAARSAAGSAAGSAARSAAWSAARSALKDTVTTLQKSAVDLVNRMIDA